MIHETSQEIRFLKKMVEKLKQRPEVLKAFLVGYSKRTRWERMDKERIRTCAQECLRGL